MGLLLKKGDLIEVIAGKEKGKQGKILKVFPDDAKVLVEGVNKVKRHTKPSQQNPQGGIVEKEAKLHYSNVLAVDSKTGKGGRLSVKRDGNKKTRFFRKTGTELKS